MRLSSENHRQRDWFDKGGRHGLENRVADLEKILPQLSNLGDLNALDIGAAEGDISAWLATHYHRVHAIEAMQRVFEKLSTRTRAIANLSCEQADIRDYQTREIYDHVFFLGVLHYFLDDATKATALRKALSLTRSLCFVRTGIRDQKVKYGLDLDKLEKYTPVSVFREAAAEGFDAALIDNASRGTKDQRLGDLVVFRKKDAAMPPLTELLRGFSTSATLLD